MNHTNDGFLNSILNDEDLQLMDMAVNEGQTNILIVFFTYLPIYNYHRQVRICGHMRFIKRLSGNFYQFL